MSAEAYTFATLRDAYGDGPVSGLRQRPDAARQGRRMRILPRRDRATVRLVTANIRNKPDLARWKVRADAGRIKHLGGVICWQEIGEEEDRADVATALGRGWRTLWHGATPISVRTRHFRVISHGWRWAHESRPDVSPVRGTAWCVLEHKATRIRFAVVNAHFVSSAWGNKPVEAKEWRRSRWETHYRSFGRLIAELCQGGRSIVLVGGDFNRGNLSPEFAGSRIVKWLTERDGIDYLMAVGNVGRVRLVESGRVRTNELHTDHAARWAKITIGAPR